MSRFVKSKATYPICFYKAIQSSSRKIWSLLNCGLVFHGRDETIESVVLENALGNSKLIVHNIQKNIVHAAAIETMDAIMKDLGDGFFSILLDEFHDVSIQEQTVIAFSLCGFQGHVVECFLSLVHVSDMTVLSLKAAIEAVFFKHNLSMSRICEQDYDREVTCKENLMVLEL